MPDRFDDEGEAECDAERERKAEPRPLLECLAAEVAEQGRVGGPDDTRDDVLDDEAPPRERGDVTG